MQKFEEIKSQYKVLHDEYLKTHNLLIKYFDHGVWAPSIPKEIYRLFDRLADKNKTFLDLGSGDGLAVMIASLFFKHAYGVELDKGMYECSLKMKETLKVENATFIHDDFYNIDFGNYDYLFIAPDKEFSLKFENKLNRELKGRLIVYSSIFQPKMLKEIMHLETKHFDIYIYENMEKK